MIQAFFQQHSGILDRSLAAVCDYNPLQDIRPSPFLSSIYCWEVGHLPSCIHTPYCVYVVRW